MKNNFFEYISALKMALIKLVEKTFTVCQKSAKTVKVLFHVGFVVYGIWVNGDIFSLYIANIQKATIQLATILEVIILPATKLM